MSEERDMFLGTSKTSEISVAPKASKTVGRSAVPESKGGGRGLTKIALKTTLGAGIGVIGGVLGSIIAVQALEMAVPALLITKAAGVIGGTAGMLFGLNSTEKERAKARKSLSNF